MQYLFLEYPYHTIVIPVRHHARRHKQQFGFGEYYDRDILIGELEKVSGFTNNYILVLFRKHVGMSPMQYLTWIRIAKPKSSPSNRTSPLAKSR
ncbi:hypothetical protein [Cohnella silvisoli]|uniref:AraC family transcriptional regulator n=1 Tax=Cohnella silvisoli TaxID=2873699 RepID=A0ABV1KLQ2_9BACL|nr:hypothetical protein [Cohnella silvisoli]MCD9020640.1 hypothetical protein [Cohnella silvisoli]